MISKLAVVVVIAAVVVASGAWIYVARNTGEIDGDAASLPEREAGVLLGTSRLIGGDGPPNFFFSARIETAARLFRSGKVKYLIVSGNQADGGRAAGGYDEPSDMRDALIAAGVPKERIYRDYAGFRTLDSMLRANEIFGLTRAIVVSQRFHLERALFLAKSNGLDFTGFEAPDPPAAQTILPRVREIGARMLAIVDVWRGRGPRLGGEKIALGQDPPS